MTPSQRRRGEREGLFRGQKPLTTLIPETDSDGNPRRGSLLSNGQNQGESHSGKRHELSEPTIREDLLKLFDITLQIRDSNNSEISGKGGLLEPICGFQNIPAVYKTIVTRGTGWKNH